MTTLLTFLLALGCETTSPPVSPTESPATSATQPSSGSNAPSLDAPPDVASVPSDAILTESGLAYRIISKGQGEKHPTATSEVEVHYTGWQTNGTMFDSSHKKGRPLKMPLNRVISGWTEGVQLLVEGDKARFWIPEDLAYKGRPGPPAGMLVFDIELLSIAPTLTERFPAPEDVASPPPDAKRTSTGLAYKVLKAGTGAAHPTESDKVAVQYTGWKTDGTTFDSSFKRGRPATFRVNGVIAGWTEALQLMVEGEQIRVWIPEDLAYKGRKGSPSGMLVFDVELLEIK